MRSQCVPLSGDADGPCWSHGHFIGPRDDRISALLMVGGWSLVAVGMWLFGQFGLWFEQRPDLGGGGSLLAGSLLTASVVSARWAAHRLRTRGGNPASLWCLIPRPPDGGRDYKPENRATRTMIVVAGVAGGLLGGAGSAAIGAFGDGGLSSDSLTLLSMVLFAAMVSAVSTWGRRRIMDRVPRSHRVEPVRDRAASAAATAAALLGIATCWAAGLARVPIVVDNDWMPATPVLAIAGMATVAAANFRLRHLARRQAASATTPLASAAG